jgi:hypothetical protein
MRADREKTMDEGHQGEVEQAVDRPGGYHQQRHSVNDEPFQQQQQQGLQDA